MAIGREGAFGRFMEETPPWAKGLLVAGGLAIIGITYFSIKSAMNKSKVAAAANADGQKAQSDLIVLAQNGIQPSYVQSDYVGFAQTLIDAFNGCNINTDGINEIMGKMKNTADVLSLITAFGARAIEPCWMNPYCATCGTIGWITYQMGSNAGTLVSLPQALQKSSLGAGYGSLVTNVNAILAGNNVNYQF